MTSFRPGARWAVVAALTIMAGACSSSGPHGAGTPATLAAPEATTPLSWLTGQAEAANGTPPSFTAAGVCGSDTETYLAELLHTLPTRAKVLREWADIVPGGKEVLVSGTVTSTHLGPADLPISHPYGYDLSMDVALDPAFLPFNRALGPAEGRAGELHVEISSGLIPHRVRASSAAPGQTWMQLSEVNLTGFQPGFDHPAVGDRVLLMGRWIVDCGHHSYATELHPVTFLAWVQARGSASVVRTYFNPYRDTQTYSPDPAVLGAVDDASRFERPGVKTLPPYLIDELLRLATGQVDHLRADELVEATHASPVDWRVCAPGGSSAGGGPRVAYDIVGRPGVDVQVSSDSTSCVTVRTALGGAYRPLDAGLRACALPWADLAREAEDALHTRVDVLGLVERLAPGEARTRVRHDPETACADALAGPDVDPSPTGQHLRTDAGQPFPFYGVLTVER